MTFVFDNSMTFVYLYLAISFCHLKSTSVFQTRVLMMSRSTPSSTFNQVNPMGQMKEEARSQNSSLEKIRLELINLLMEAPSEADIVKKLQREVECKALLEDLEKQVRQ